MPNNRYSDPLAYTITNNPGSRYTTPLVNYTAGLDRISDVVRSAGPAPWRQAAAPKVQSGTGAVVSGRYLLAEAGKLAGMALLAGLAVLITSGNQTKK